jgi:UDP-N-acetylglucosamine 2-epimerase (non-hydrolysing)
MSFNTLLFVFGTRPEAIKMAPLILKAKAEPSFNVKVCVTAQHRQMLDAVLAVFGITPDFDLNIMKPNQDLFDITATIMLQIRDVLETIAPDLVLVHGDTTTTFTTALSAFYRQIPVAHVEAGLRTHQLYSPWPEEANRQLVSRLAQFHFAPTLQNRANLLEEGIEPGRIHITGNTVIDALQWVQRHRHSDNATLQTLWQEIEAQGYYHTDRRYILVTGHRRENFGEKFIQICEALKSIALANPTIDIIYPVHLNPNVQKPVYALLGDQPNIYLLKPLDYEPFILMLANAFLVITDSGGIQEEAPGFGIPVLVMRDTTERQEAVDAGTVKLVGTDAITIATQTQALIDDPKRYNIMAQAHNPYGDGTACDKIIQVLKGEH